MGAASFFNSFVEWIAFIALLSNNHNEFLTVPGVVKFAVTKSSVNTQVLVMWGPPQQLNGIIVAYQVIYSTYNSNTTIMSGPLHSSTTNYTIMNLGELYVFHKSTV